MLRERKSDFYKLNLYYVFVSSTTNCNSVSLKCGGSGIVEMSGDDISNQDWSFSVLNILASSLFTLNFPCPFYLVGFSDITCYHNRTTMCGPGNRLWNKHVLLNATHAPVVTHYSTQQQLDPQCVEAHEALSLWTLYNDLLEWGCDDTHIAFHSNCHSLSWGATVG